MSPLRWMWLAMALAGCGERAEITTPPGGAPLRGELSLEMRDSLGLEVAPAAGDGARFAITPSAGFGLLEAGATLRADGFVEPLPEASATLYRARFDIDATPSDGLCGGAPAALSLSLHRQGDNAAVAGGISVYCGADTSAPPARVLRLFGRLE